MLDNTANRPLLPRGGSRSFGVGAKKAGCGLQIKA